MVICSSDMYEYCIRRKDLMLIPELAVNPLASKIIDAFLTIEGYVCMHVCMYMWLSVTTVTLFVCTHVQFH